ncbi:MAG TPA: hypothetical protein DDW31_06110 [candidate division Zixibacteria bacterium]|nr:hypothetical protein [candidate division Zixibacteria bacterium]
MRVKYIVISLLLAALAAVSCGPVLVSVKRMERARLQIPLVTRVAVVDFEDATRHGPGPAVGSRLVAELNSQGYYQVLERARIQSVMKEHAFNLTGAVDPATARELGGLLGVDAIITGEILAYDVRTTVRTEKVEKKEGTGQYEEVEKTNPFTKKKYKVKEEIMKTVLVDEDRFDKSGTVSVNYRMIDIASGQVVVSKTHTKSYQKTLKKNTVGDDEVLAELLTGVTAGFVGDISPHHVTVSKRLLSSKADPKNLGQAYAKQGEWQRAVEIWERSASQAPNDAALWHNIGVGQEAMGRIEQAELAYNKALQADPGNKMFIENVAQIKRAFRGGLPTGQGGAQALAEPSSHPTELIPRIMKIEPTGEVYINIGNKSGIKAGDRFMVVGEREIRNPDTGELMDTDIYEKAELAVSKVMENISVCRVIKPVPGNKLAVKDKVKPVK